MSFLEYRKKRLACIVLCLLSVFVGSSAYAQIDPRFAPQSAPQPADNSAVEGVFAKPPVAPAPESLNIIIPELKGLVLIDNAQALVAGGVSASDIVPQNLPMLENPIVHDRLAAYLGKPVTQTSLQSIGAVISDWYREMKYPFVDVSVPAGQDVTNGVVQIVVLESRSGKILTQGNRWFSDNTLIRQVRLAPGDRINIQNLEDDKNWINQNPFRLVNIVASRSEQTGVTDLTIDTVMEKFPVRPYAGYSNSGTPIIGHDRWNLGIIWGNALWLDDQFAYQFSSSDDFWHSRESYADRPHKAAFQGHTANYEIATGWRDKISIYGTYLEASPLLGPFVGITGTDLSLGIRYITQLPSTRKFDEKLQGGFDFKISNNNLEFGGQSVGTTTQIAQFVVEYDATRRDDYGQTEFSDSITFSPGGLTDRNTDALFQAQTNSAAIKANYLFDHLTLTRITGLPLDGDLAKNLGWFGATTSITKFVGQISNRNLLPSEQLGAGGVESVRGYDERVENGSNGILVSEEIRSPAFSLAKLLLKTDSAWNDVTQLGAFWDYSNLFDNNTLPGQPSSVRLESVGLGLHMLAGPDTNVRFDLDYGWQLRKLPGLADTSQFGHIAITIAY